MSKSTKTFAVVLGYQLTEQQVITLAGIVVVVLLLGIFRAIASWIVGGTVKTAILVQAPQEATAAQKTDVAAKSEQGEEQEKIAKSSEELLTDTSERRRTLHDFVTPDSIHADVLKQTLNNDYPYVTLKPNPTFINTIPTGAMTDVKQTPTQGPLPVISGKSGAPLLTTTTEVKPSTSGNSSVLLPPIPESTTVATAVVQLPVKSVEAPATAEKKSDVVTGQPPVSLPAVAPLSPTPSTPVEPPPVTQAPLNDAPVAKPLVTAPNYSPTDSLLP